MLFSNVSFWDHRYPLLIKELIKHTADSHPDKEGLTQASQEVKLLAAYINQYKSDYENLCSIKLSLKKYRGRPITDYAPLLKDGDLKVCRIFVVVCSGSQARTNQLLSLHR